VVDGHPVTREGQKALLSAESDMQIVGEADTGEEALQLVTEVASAWRQVRNLRSLIPYSMVAVVLMGYLRLLSRT
jgi:chemotaxis response regulator CheB